MADNTIDIFNIEPHKVSRDLRGYTVMFYGEPKTGKTTIASHFPDSLLLAFEIGYLAIPGIRPQICRNWSDFKKVLRQLNSNAGPDSVYKNVIVDTTDICYEYCEKFICDREGVEKIGDIPYGQGYKMAREEYDRALRQIPQMGYGLVLISHAQTMEITDSEGEKYNKTVSTLPKGPSLVVNRMSDIIGYAESKMDDEGHVETVLHMRGTPRFQAGSRFKYAPDVIPFTYDALVNAIGDAIDAEAQALDNKFVTNERIDDRDAVPELDFEGLKGDFQKLVKAIKTNVSADEYKDKWDPTIRQVIEDVLGKGRKMSDITPSQVEQLAVIVDTLTDLVGQGL